MEIEVKNKEIVSNGSDKVALITGSSAGVGEKVAIFLAKLNFNLMITGRDVQRIKKVAENCRQITKQKVLEFKADLLNEDEIEKLIAKTINGFGRLDVLVHCAQITVPSCITDPDFMENYERVFNTNVRSVIILTTLALPYIVETKGCIMTLSTDSGLKPYESETAFGVSEAAIDWFTKGLALEMKYKGITVLSLNSALIMRPDFESKPFFSATLHSRL